MKIQNDAILWFRRRINDPEIIGLYIVEAIEKIKNYKMSNKIKTNRINFFATLK